MPFRELGTSILNQPTREGKPTLPHISNNKKNNQPIKNNKIMEMAKYIMQILRTQPTIVMSWGFNSPVAINNGLRFKVQGYLHKGWVEVVYNEGRDLFEVKTIKRDGTVKNEIDDVYFDSLVDTIDGMVEKCANYHEKVKETYSF